MIGTAELLSEIEKFLARTGMAATTFGQKAVNDGKFVERLHNGGTVTLPKAEAILQFMATWEADGFKPRQRRSRHGARPAA